MHSDNLPGIVTLLFTDIEGSTRLWEREPERMPLALTSHDSLLRAAVTSNCGVVVKMAGDGLHASFDDPVNALNATLTMQRALTDAAATNGVALRVRCGLHAGPVERRDNDFFGSAVNRAARIMVAAHGGQVLLSQAVAALIGDRLPADVTLRDLGSVRLRDLVSPERVYQVVHPLLRQDFPALRTLEASPNNLPQQATSFIGRERELAEIKTLLANARLLTLLGAGGVGKTRLSLHVAADVLDDYPDGVWFVGLASVTDPANVPPALAQVLGVREESGESLSQTLCAHAKSRRMLVVLDNCEHLIDACAHLAEGLLQGATDLRVLATAREPLRVAAEQIFPLGVLSLPNSNATLPDVARSHAVQLFIDRARSQVPLFTLTGENVRAVAELCMRLDGIPFALELAAARISTLPVETIAERLSDRFQLLNRGSRLALPRQKTLHSMLDWSYDLLTDAEKKLFARLPVFAGGWTLEAAESVASGTDIATVEIVDLLTNLAEKSLVVVEQRGQRYRMLETTHEYAREQFKEETDRAEIHRRHRDYFMTMAERAAPSLRTAGHDQSTWLETLNSEQDNLRAALAWSLNEPQGTEAALRLCGSLESFWMLQAQSREGRKWCDAAVAHASGSSRTAVYARAVLAAGVLAHRLGDYGAARTSLELALAVAKDLNDRTLETVALIRLGNVEANQDNFAQAQAAYGQAVAVCRETGDRRRESGTLQNLAILAINHGDLPAAMGYLHQALSLTRALNNRALEAAILQLMGTHAVYCGDLAGAKGHCDHSLSILREIGARTAEGDPLRCLAKIACACGNIAEARALFLEALAASQEHGDPQYLDEIAIMALALSRLEDAARFAGAADALRHAFGLAIWPIDRKRFHEYRERCLSVLGKATYDAAYGAGRALIPDGVLEMTRGWLQEIEEEAIQAHISP
jgi:predicted ATPase/class 3 adenylate cyclase